MVLKVEYKTNCYKEENYKKNSFLNFRSTLEIMFNKKLEHFTTHPHSEKLPVALLLQSCYQNSGLRGGLGVCKSGPIAICTPRTPLNHNDCSIRHRIEQGLTLRRFFLAGGGRLEEGIHFGTGSPHFPLPVINCDDV